MLQYLTPTTLEEMYKELDKARTDILSSVKSRSDFTEIAKEYHSLNEMLREIDDQYEATTGEALWAKVAIEMIAEDKTNYVICKELGLSYRPGDSSCPKIDALRPDNGPPAYRR